MNKLLCSVAMMATVACILPTHAAVITVTTTNNPGAGSLLEALSNVHDGDEIQFNIPGPGPHYFATPFGGYPYITANDITIDGYSQPGAVANSNSILQPNNAQIKIVLDSRHRFPVPGQRRKQRRHEQDSRQRRDGWSGQGIGESTGRVQCHYRYSCDPDHSRGREPPHRGQLSGGAARRKAGLQSGTRSRYSSRRQTYL